MKPTPKNNYQVWIIATLVALIVGISYFTNNTETISINQSRFEQMVMDNDVEKNRVHKKQGKG